MTKGGKDIGIRKLLNITLTSFMIQYNRAVLVLMPKTSKCNILKCKSISFLNIFDSLFFRLFTLLLVLRESKGNF